MTQRPLVLVTNDDGIDAPGLWHLAEAVHQFADVIVVAPASNQSGMSAAFTLRRDIDAGAVESRLAGVDAFRVDGTPSDAVVHGLRHFAPRRVSMIVSGVNPGPNIGRDILHSGTVMAAMQGYLRGLPAVASSIASFYEAHLDAVSIVAAQIAKDLLESGQTLLLNVNAPDLPLEQFNGVRVVSVADVSLSRVLDISTEPGSTQRQLVIRRDVSVDADTDVAAILDNAVSVTPLHNDLTRYSALAAAASLIGEPQRLTGSIDDPDSGVVN